MKLFCVFFPFFFLIFFFLRKRKWKWGEEGKTVRNPPVKFFFSFPPHPFLLPIFFLGGVSFILILWIFSLSPQSFPFALSSPFFPQVPPCFFIYIYKFEFNRFFPIYDKFLPPSPFVVELNVIQFLSFGPRLFHQNQIFSLFFFMKTSAMPSSSSSSSSFWLFPEFGIHENF